MFFIVIKYCLMMKPHDFQQKSPSLTANLDRNQTMLKFLQEQKILNDLTKGVQSLKTVIYPSILQVPNFHFMFQKEAIPVLKKHQNKTVIIKYSPMSGVKLTFLLPLLNHLLRHVVSTVHNDKAKRHYLLILCNSTHRCKEFENLISTLTQFC